MLCIVNLLFKYSFMFQDVQDVRMCYLQFMTSFLMVGDKTTIRQIVETKGERIGCLVLLTDQVIHVMLLYAVIHFSCPRNTSLQFHPNKDR